jgi:hypothetical protein
MLTLGCEGYNEDTQNEHRSMFLNKTILNISAVSLNLHIA